jgi:hypothetical protein
MLFSRYSNLSTAHRAHPAALRDASLAPSGIPGRRSSARGYPHAVLLPLLSEAARTWIYKGELPANPSRREPKHRQSTVSSIQETERDAVGSRLSSELLKLRLASRLEASFGGARPYFRRCRRPVAARNQLHCFPLTCCLSMAYLRSPGQIPENLSSHASASEFVSQFMASIGEVLCSGTNEADPW